ncbi:hypothetical protein E2C01_061787 [Portunus trituberculatus]|uniref:Uncharacterized protein n=1 Tax=Portunus trituberculatus TaxID=210409 RepID=A0A5B7H676_PORTR|nr:hypothetical protein [Portunus trituberculatus]
MEGDKSGVERRGIGDRRGMLRGRRGVKGRRDRRTRVKEITIKEKEKPSQVKGGVPVRQRAAHRQPPNHEKIRMTSMTSSTPVIPSSLV